MRGFVKFLIVLLAAFIAVQGITQERPEFYWLAGMVLILGFWLADAGKTSTIAPPPTLPDVNDDAAETPTKAQPIVFLPDVYTNYAQPPPSNIESEPVPKPRRKAPTVDADDEDAPKVVRMTKPPPSLPFKPMATGPEEEEDVFFKPTYNGLLDPINGSRRLIDSGYMLRVTAYPSANEGILTLSIDHPGQDVRPYDIAQNRDAILAEFIEAEGFGARVTILNDGQVVLEDDTWRVITKIGVRFS